MKIKNTCSHVKMQCNSYGRSRIYERDLQLKAVLTKGTIGRCLQLKQRYVEGLGGVRISKM